MSSKAPLMLGREATDPQGGAKTPSTLFLASQPAPGTSMPVVVGIGIEVEAELVTCLNMSSISAVEKGPLVWLHKFKHLIKLSRMLQSINISFGIGRNINSRVYLSKKLKIFIF